MPAAARVPEHVSAAADRIDPDGGAWITTTVDEAIAAARTGPDGPLAGTTFAVKDLIDTAGVRTTYGSPLYADHVPVVSATVVRRLELLGSVSLGKTNLNEFAYGVSGYNPTFGVIRSPLDSRWTAGGSSGGSAAAVGCGAVDIAIGTDTTGSVRIPAACCGVTGFTCAHGTQPMDGVYPLAPSMDRIGYLVRDLELLRVILGIDGPPPAVGVRVRSIADLALPPLPAEHVAAFRHQALPLHRARSMLHPDAYGRDLRLKLRDPEGSSYAEVARTLADWCRDFEAAMRGVDVVTGPVFDGDPPTVEEVLAEYRTDSLATSERLQAHTAAASVLGWPAMAVPTEDGPAHLLARPGDEALLLSCAASIALPAEEQCHAR